MRLNPIIFRSSVADCGVLFHPLDMGVVFFRNEFPDTALMDALASRSDLDRWVVDDRFEPTCYLRTFRQPEGASIDIRVLKFFTTTYCNLACRYCLIERNLERRGCTPAHVSVANGTAVLAKFSELALMQSPSPKTLMLYGGEPLLNWGTVLALIQHARELEAQKRFNGPLEIVLETNGTLVTPPTQWPCESIGSKASCPLTEFAKSTTHGAPGATEPDPTTMPQRGTAYFKQPARPP